MIEDHIYNNDDRKDDMNDMIHNESDGWLFPYKEVPKYVGFILKKKFMTYKEEFLQAVGYPMIST